MTSDRSSHGLFKCRSGSNLLRRVSILMEFIFLTMERPYGFTSDGNSFFSFPFSCVSLNVCVVSDVWNKIKLLNFLECLLEPLHYPIMVHSTKRSHLVSSRASQRVGNIIVTVAVVMATRNLSTGRCQVEKSLLPLSQGVSGPDGSSVSSTVLDR